MGKADISKFIIPVKLANTDLHQISNSTFFSTEDLVYLDSYKDVYNLDKEERVVTPTDYALANGASQCWFVDSKTGKEGTTRYWLRSGASLYSDAIYTINKNGEIYEGARVDDKSMGICPAMHLNVDSIISARSMSNNFGKIAHVKDTDGKVIYHTIEFGEYPKTKASNSDELELLFNKNKILATGKKYIGHLEAGSKDKYVENLEYEYQGQKYVRVKSNPFEEKNFYSDGEKISPYGYVWIKVEPITWTIRNWDEMPKSINPKGNEKATYIDVRTEEAIIGGIPFYPKDRDKYNFLWQNSSIRGFLNAIDVRKIKTNGFIQYSAKNGGDFSAQGFLQEAFDKELEQIDSLQNHQENQENIKVKQVNPYGLSFDELDNDTLLKLYVKSNATIFLHGPSGVGKSGRVKQLDPTATRITLRPQMNPEEIDGTLDRETGKFIPPLWYTQLCEKCKADPNKKHVLFIDELTNVKPTVQSLIYSIVLDRAGKDGLWPLPENAVVVAAGNESADNLAAYPLTNALFRRFSHIYYEVDKNDWLDWATGISKIETQEHTAKNNSNRAKIHPAIVAYIMSRNGDVLNQDLDEENPHIVTDPRKWEIASNVLYSTKNPNALKPAIGEELTADFVDFVKNIQLSVEDVVNNRYDARDYEEMDISQKLSTLVGLCVAGEKDLPAVRSFISKTMGKEVLSAYDSLWIRNDPERAQIIAECALNIVGEDGYGIEY
ncbi:MAG: hypothetical protein J6T74_00915 [Clostridia bacterium]|nr:hypothetical protein [Clostridia bacterium]